MPWVIVVGSLNVDRPWHVRRHAAVGETVLGEKRPKAPGGKGLNQAVAARRMGAQTRLVGLVGDDADGAWLRRVADDEGIDVGTMSAAASAPTGTALIMVDDTGANTVTVDPGANALLAVDELPVEVGDVVVAQLEVPVEAVREAFRIGRDRGATTILNPSPIGDGKVLVAEADVVVVNEHEIAELAGYPGAPARVPRTADEALELARSVRSTSLQRVVVTLGSAGLVGVGPDEDVVLDGIDVEAVDTVGAGDCFLGVLAASLATDLSFEDALELANRAAALAVTRPGAADAMPFRHEVVTD